MIQLRLIKTTNTLLVKRTNMAKKWFFIDLIVYAMIKLYTI